MKRYYLFMALILAAMLLVAACGNTANDVPDIEAPQDEMPEQKQTLTISVCWGYNFLDLAVERFKELHPDVEIVLHKYDDDTYKYKQQVGAQLMAGEADDLLEAYGFSDAELFDSGLVADFYPLMKSDPAFNEDDYFTNVFDGVAYKDKLAVFPNGFFYQFIGVNNTFSPELVKRFKQYDKITYQELFDLYNSLEDKGSLYMSRDIDAVTAFMNNFNTFVNFENKQCYFNTPGFIKFITDAKNGTNPQKIADGELGEFYNLGGYLSPSGQKEHALQYAFLRADSGCYQMFMTLNGEEVFTHFIPLVDEDGNALLRLRKHFFINQASENKELAWEFVKILTTPEANHEMIFPYFAVKKDYFQKNTAAVIADFIEQRKNEGNTVDGETAEIVQQAMARYEEYNAMPMEYQRYIGADTVMDIVMEVMTAFYQDTLTAEQASSELQNKISLYLME